MLLRKTLCHLPTNSDLPANYSEHDFNISNLDFSSLTFSFSKICFRFVFAGKRWTADGIGQSNGKTSRLLNEEGWWHCGSLDGIYGGSSSNKRWNYAFFKKSRWSRKNFLRKVFRNNISHQCKLKKKEKVFNWISSRVVLILMPTEYLIMLCTHVRARLLSRASLSARLMFMILNYFNSYVYSTRGCSLHFKYVPTIAYDHDLHQQLVPKNKYFLILPLGIPKKYYIRLD